MFKRELFRNTKEPFTIPPLVMPQLMQMLLQIRQRSLNN